MSEKHIEDSSAPLIDHLIELRSRLIRSISAFVVAMLLCFAIAEPLFDFLAQPIKHSMEKAGHDPELIFTGAHKVFFTYVQLSMFGGFFFAFPIIANQLWRFVAPGLYQSEQSAFLPFLIATPVLFVVGSAFAYYAALPLAFDFFLSFEKTPDPDGDGIKIAFLGTVDEYLGLTMKFILAFGIAFQLPVALTLMAKAGLVGSQWLRDNRKYCIVGMLVVAALFTPPDVFSMMLMFGVVYGLYEVSILLVVMVEKKREEKLRAEGYYDDADDDDEDEDEPDPLLTESEAWDGDSRGGGEKDK
ncbi:MAG TPA: twin-arginine translocase subunit TatC [Thermohalobaculum sp.]|nr:twin-arginine translocase subunit TatC [Thermohalobaculum sp.]